MVAVALGQGDEAGAVEVDAVVVDEIRVLPGILAAGAEPDLPLLLVDAVDAAHDVFALRDLVLDLALLRVDQVEVPPAVALGGVDDLVGLSSQLTGLRSTFSVWAVQMNVSVFSSMRFRAAPVCASTSITRNRWWPRSIFS